MKPSVTIHWFRRDLRLEDNAALYHALSNHNNVLPLFIFDTEILSDLNNKKDARVNFIYNSIIALRDELIKHNSALIIEFGNPIEVWKKLVEKYHIEGVVANTDYEPYAIMRDKEISTFLNSINISFTTFKDQVIFEKSEVVKEDGSPYLIFTPYSRKYKEKLSSFYLKSYPNAQYFSNFYKSEQLPIIILKDLGFEPSDIPIPSSKIPEDIIADYEQTRDYPYLNGTTRLSLHLRFGTISIRKLASIAVNLNEKYFNELIWREFYQMILWHFPQIVSTSFKKQYDNITWRNNDKEFELWCAGQTGYPMVDAGMRELNATGFMHNRVRMVVASFLTKHLLIDWRKGEAYFAEKLLDYDLASNNGGWQWAAGCGVDAAPYFRIFNPSSQAIKFDPELKYIRKWIPEIDSLQYPLPIVEHSYARKRCLEIYKSALDSQL